MASIRKLTSGKYICEIRRKGHKPVSKTFTTKLAATAWGAEREQSLGVVDGIATPLLHGLLKGCTFLTLHE